jgi:hypothetical protein
MALLFSFSIAMNKFVIRSRHRELTNGRFSLRSASLSGCADSKRMRNWTFVSGRQNQHQRVSHSDKPFERGSARRAIDTKVSIDTIVQ